MVNLNEGFKETLGLRHLVLLPKSRISFELFICIESIMSLVQRKTNTVDCLDESSENFTSVKALCVRSNLPFLRNVKDYTLLFRLDDALRRNLATLMLFSSKKGI